MENEHGFTDRMRQIRDGKLIDVLRVRTAMYTGERTLSAAYFFLQGFSLARHVYQLPGDELPPDFHDWVAYRLHFRESTSGYRKMILDRIIDESAALDRFFELLDEHRSRHARIIAKLHLRDPQVLHHESDLRGSARETTGTGEFSLVVYTDDPGFFAIHGDKTAQGPQFHPALSRFHPKLKSDEKNLEILDQERFNRLLEEDEAFRDGRSI